MEYKLRQPKYYNDFKCIGGKCFISCCQRWDIIWRGREIKKVLGANPSEELTALLKTSFENKERKITDDFSNDEEHFTIAFREDGTCPFHNEEGLCMIQKELGEEYLSTVCTIYPRISHCHKDFIIRSCSSSCPAVQDFLFNDINSTRLETQIQDIDLHNSPYLMGDTSEKLSKYPVLKYRIELMNFYNKLLTDRGISLETAIILGALASKRFTDSVENERIDEIPNIINEYEGKLRDKATIKSIESIEPNPLVRFKLVNNLLITHFDNTSISFTISNLHDGQNLIPENYERGLNKLNEAFKGREYFLKNIASNMLIHLGMPFYLNNCTILENYAYFALSVAAIKLLGISLAEKRPVEDIEIEFKRIVSMLSRTLSHSPTVAEKTIEDLKKSGFTSAAHIAFIIK